MLSGFLFLFSFFTWSDSRLQICVALANLYWNINKNQISQIRVFLIYLWSHACRLLNSRLCSLFQCGVVIEIRRRILISVETSCVFIVFVFWFSLNHIPIKYRVAPIKKTSRITLGCLIGLDLVRGELSYTWCSVVYPNLLQMAWASIGMSHGHNCFLWQLRPVHAMTFVQCNVYPRMRKITCAVTGCEELIKTQQHCKPLVSTVADQFINS